MLIRPAELEAIRDGRVDLAFRRWDRPRLLVGTRMRTAIGLIEVTAVDRVAVKEIRAEDARRAGAGSRASFWPGSLAAPSGPSFASACASPGRTPGSRCASRSTSRRTSGCGSSLASSGWTSRLPTAPGLARR